MTIFMFVILLPMLIIVPNIGRYFKKIQKEISDEQAKLSEISEESFSNIRTIKAFASEDI